MVAAASWLSSLPRSPCCFLIFCLEQHLSISHGLLACVAGPLWLLLSSKQMVPRPCHSQSARTKVFMVVWKALDVLVLQPLPHFLCLPARCPVPSCCSSLPLEPLLSICPTPPSFRALADVILNYPTLPPPSALLLLIYFCLSIYHLSSCSIIFLLSHSSRI